MTTLKLLGGAFAPHRAADTILVGLGLSTALLSFSFAAWMIVVGPPGGTQLGRAFAATNVAPIHPSEAGVTLPTVQAGAEPIDFTPTGTIPSDPEAPAGRQAQAGQGAVLHDFAVRDVFEGTALVEAQGTLHMVSSGDMLEGAGKVLAIERKGRGWIVRTAGGTIRQRR